MFNLTIFRRIIVSFSEFISSFFITLIRNNKSSFASYLRKKLYNTQCFVDTNVFISNMKNFEGQEKSALYHSTYIQNNQGNFYIGKNSHLGTFCYVNVCHGSVLIGEDVAIGPGTKIIAYSNHYKFGKKVTEEKITSSIQIKNNVLIGANCTILPGTTINNNTVIGAGAVVKGELEANVIYAGVPCKKIKCGWYE